MKPIQYITVGLEEGLTVEKLNHILQTIATTDGVSGVKYTNEEEDKRQAEIRKQETLTKLKDFYDNMSDEEFKSRMEKAGFEVVEGKSGQLFLEEE